MFVGNTISVRRGGIMVVLALLVAVVAAPQEASARHRNNDESEPSCSCSTTLGLSRPTVQFSDGILVFVPRADVMIRSRGPSGAPGWTATIHYNGLASFTSGDVTPPADVAFSGDKAVASGPCGSRYHLQGVQLGSFPLGVSAGLVGEGQELTGVLRLDASVAGCGFDEVHRQLRFKVLEFGNLKIGFWRTVR